MKNGATINTCATAAGDHDAQGPRSLPACIASPITGNEHAAVLKATIASQSIIDGYERHYKYDVRSCFADLPFFGLYECQETTFNFYYPPSLAAGEALYRHLETFPWNYKEEKWEHGAALRHIRNRCSILDVGCGRGWFLQRARTQADAAVTGIELNQSAAEFARQRGLAVCDELLEQHAQAHPECYDVVTSFQVLEHIAVPRRFIMQCLQVLKPNGLLIYSVPNNQGFLKFAESAVLNGPPHHMGLWARRSLEALTRFFPISLRAFEIEPLSELAWYQHVMEQRYLPHAWQRSLFYRIGGARIFSRFVRENAHSIAGHSILAVYQKTAESAENA